MKGFIEQYNELKSKIECLASQKSAMEDHMDDMTIRILSERFSNDDITISSFVIDGDRVRLFLRYDVVFTYTPRQHGDTIVEISFSQGRLVIETNVSRDGWDAPVFVPLSPEQKKWIEVDRRKLLINTANSIAHDWRRYQKCREKFEF
jgi:hypothetical protein